MSFQMLILISVLCFAAHSEAKWKLKNNVYIIDSIWDSETPPEKVHLYCNVSGKDNTSVYWKNDNKQYGHGKSLEFHVKEPHEAGNFTCWSATNELLSFSTLYVAKINNKNGIFYQFLKKEGSNSNLKCIAKNFSGNFVCSWMITPQSQDRNLEFAVRSLNTDNVSGSVTCEEPVRDTTNLQKYSVSCKKERPCPVAEEYQKIRIYLDVFDKNQYENDTVIFFIKDIIKPDVTECQIARDGNTYQVTWKPPQTWSKPVSYFKLTFQIKRGGTSPQIYEVDNPTELENGNRLGCSIQNLGKRMYYIRAREYYNKNSAWSEWSKACSFEPQAHHTHDAKSMVPCKSRRIGAEDA